MDKLTREEMCYEDALELIEKSLKGEVVDYKALSTSIQLLSQAFISIYLDRMNTAKREKAFPEQVEDEKED